MLSTLNYSVIIAMMILSLVCWGSWANTQKLATKIRFEYFYLDFSFGVLATSFIIALIFGSNQAIGSSFLSNLIKADFIHIAIAFFGGIIFNVANFLLVVAIEMAGMSVAFPIAIGIATIIGGLLNYLIDPQGYLPFISAGMVMMLFAVISASLAYGRIKSVESKFKKKGFLIAVFCGLLMSLWSPIVTFSYLPGTGSLDVFGAFSMMSIGIISSSVALIPILLKNPIIPPKVNDKIPYIKEAPSRHIGGLLGGMIWAIGTMSFYLASTRAGAAVAYTFGQGAPLMATAWGLFIWKEFKGAEGSNKFLIALFSFYIGGLILLAKAGS